MLSPLLPRCQQVAKPIELALTALKHLASHALTHFARDLSGFLAVTANVRGKAKFAQGRSHFVVVIAFVQAHALCPLLRRLQSLRHKDHNAARNILHRGLYVLRSKRNTEQAWGNTRQSPILRGWAPLQATF